MTFREHYALALAARQAGTPLPPAPEPSTTPDEPENEPETLRALPWSFAKSLSPGKTRLYIPASHNHLAVVRECGNPLKATPHILECYKCPDNDPSALASSIAIPSNLVSQSFTPPFFFHSEPDAIRAIGKALSSVEVKP